MLDIISQLWLWWLCDLILLRYWTLVQCLSSLHQINISVSKANWNLFVKTKEKERKTSKENYKIKENCDTDNEAIFSYPIRSVQNRFWRISFLLNLSPFVESTLIDYACSEIWPKPCRWYEFSPLGSFVSALPLFWCFMTFFALTFHGSFGAAAEPLTNVELWKLHHALPQNRVRASAGTSWRSIRRFLLGKNKKKFSLQRLGVHCQTIN